MAEAGSGHRGLRRWRDGRHVVVTSALGVVISVSILSDHRIGRTLSGRILVVLTTGEGLSDGDDVVGVVDVILIALDGCGHDQCPADRGDCVVWCRRWTSVVVAVSSRTACRARKLN